MKIHNFFADITVVKSIMIIYLNLLSFSYKKTKWKSHLSYNKDVLIYYSLIIRFKRKMLII